ncbi:MAG: hypothetical protein AB7G06_08555 [Bdellovibrionales bacterium]
MPNVQNQNPGQTGQGQQGRSPSYQAQSEGRKDRSANQQRGNRPQNERAGEESESSSRGGRFNS